MAKFTKEMLAPCGLNCARCKKALQENPCPGCYGEDSKKSKYCATCAIAKCEKRQHLPDGFCDKCELYPCTDVMEKETRYTNNYPVKQSPIENLKKYRSMGEEFFNEQSRKWSCACGGIICSQTGICSKCGKQYND